jgi:hypothetical protein
MSRRAADRDGARLIWTVARRTSSRVVRVSVTNVALWERRCSMKALSTFVDQLAQNAAKQPGWVPLVILTYLALPIAGIPESISIAGRVVQMSDELLAAVCTLVLFVVGDALDKAIYKPLKLEKRLAPRGLETARGAARSTLRIHDGIYGVAKALASAAGSFQSFSVQFLNEAAKLLRSLIIPAVAAGLWLVVTRRVAFGVPLIIAGGSLIMLYAWLKATHIRHLYELVPTLGRDKKCHIEDLGGMRLFFWDGVLVGSALISSQSPAGTRLHQTAAVEAAN